MDSFERCTHELITFVRGLKHLSHAHATDGPTLERPALMLLFVLSEHGAARPSELAERVHIDLSTASRQLAALENSGWVDRERDPADRRAQLVRLTAAGDRVLQANLTARRALLRELLVDWSEPERLEFARLLGRLNATLDSHAATAPNTCRETL